MVKWCRANTDTESKAVTKFQECLASKVIVKNLSEDTFLNIIGLSNYLSNEMFKAWIFDDEEQGQGSLKVRSQSL